MGKLILNLRHSDEFSRRRLATRSTGLLKKVTRLKDMWKFYIPVFHYLSLFFTLFLGSPSSVNSTACSCHILSVVSSLLPPPANGLWSSQALLLQVSARPALFLMFGASHLQLGTPGRPAAEDQPVWPPQAIRPAHAGKGVCGRTSARSPWPQLTGISEVVNL